MRNYSFIIFIVAVIAAFCIGVGSALLSVVNYDFINEITKIKKQYLFSEHEKRIILAQTKVNYFLNAVAKEDDQETVECWYRPTRDRWLTKMDQMIQRFTSQKIVSTEKRTENLYEIFNYLRRFQTYTPGISQEISRNRNLQSVFLIADPKALQDKKGDYFVRVEYTARTETPEDFIMVFYVYFEGGKPMIKKILIKGPEKSLAQIFKDRTMDGPVLMGGLLIEAK
ncbi:MAG: hypothetical protein ABIJ41_05165 [Candidatus Omnitrophota bacterium]